MDRGSGNKNNRGVGEYLAFLKLTRMVILKQLIYESTQTTTAYGYFAGQHEEKKIEVYISTVN